jgi:Fic family protein
MQNLVACIKVERENYHPIIFAAMLHLKFVSIYPFIDGKNDYTRRLQL